MTLMTKRGGIFKMSHDLETNCRGLEIKKKKGSCRVTVSGKGEPGETIHQGKKQENVV